MFFGGTGKDVFAKEEERGNPNARAHFPCGEDIVVGMAGRAFKSLFGKMAPFLVCVLAILAQAKQGYEEHDN